MVDERSSTWLARDRHKLSKILEVNQFSVFITTYDIILGATLDVSFNRSYSKERMSSICPEVQKPRNQAVAQQNETPMLNAVYSNKQMQFAQVTQRLIVVER